MNGFGRMGNAYRTPLHHIPLKETFRDIHDIIKDDGELTSTTEVTPQQVIVNYSFGHPESSDSLFPYGVGVNYINDKKLANVKVQWPKNSVKTMILY